MEEHLIIKLYIFILAIQMHEQIFNMNRNQVILTDLRWKSCKN